MIPEKYASIIYLIFRVFVGFLFFQHGAQKLFGWFGGEAQPLMGLMGLAGIIEFFGGILISVGFLTRPIALLSALLMLVAYFMAHAGRGLMPIENGGELALLYLLSFLVITVHGAGKCGLESNILKKEMF